MQSQQKWQNWPLLDESNPVKINPHPRYIYGLMTKREVSMAISFCVFMKRDGVEVHKLARNERVTVNSELAIQRHLACSGSQSQRKMRFILPAHGVSHIIRKLFLFFFFNVGVEDTVTSREVRADLGGHQRHGSAYGQRRTVRKCEY